MKTNLFVKIIIVVLLVVLAVQIVVSNQLSTTGITLAKLDGEFNDYKEKNSLLEEEVLMASSFTTIASNASSLGFVETKSYVSLSGSLPLALKQ